MTVKPTQIYIDENSKAHVSHPCDECCEWTHVDDHCGNTLEDGTDEYLCGDCFGQLAKWHIFTDSPLGCLIAIDSSLLGSNRYGDKVVSNPPKDSMVFGPNTFAVDVTSIRDAYQDLHHVHMLWDAGYLNNDAHLVLNFTELAK
jgi:hypothetical protein